MFPQKYFGEYSPVIWGVRQILSQAPAHSQWQRHLLEVPGGDKSLQGGHSGRDPLLHTVSIILPWHSYFTFWFFLGAVAGKTNFSLDHLPSSPFALEKNVGIYFEIKSHRDCATFMLSIFSDRGYNALGRGPSHKQQNRGAGLIDKTELPSSSKVYWGVKRSSKLFWGILMPFKVF